MKQAFVILFFIFASCTAAISQTFTFECICDYVAPPDCDICNTQIQSRLMNGLLIRRNGTAFRLIEYPYIVKIQGQNAVIQELIFPNPETVTIARSGTAFGTMAEYMDSLQCNCGGSGGGVTYVAGPGIVINGDTISAVDTSATNELQQIDTFAIFSGNQLCISLSADGVVKHCITLPSGSADTTIVTAGTGISVTGDGSLGSPYIITNTGDLSNTNEIQRLDTFTIVSGVLRASLLNDGVPFSSVTLPTADGSETQVNGGIAIGISGTGTTGSPYVVTSTADLAVTAGGTNALQVALNTSGQTPVFVKGMGQVTVTESATGDTIKIGGVGGIYGVSDTTQPAHVLTIAANSTLTFQSQGDSFGGVVPFRVKSDGTEPDIQGWYANGDSLVLSRTDTEFSLSTPSGLTVMSGAVLALQGDSVIINAVGAALSTEKTYLQITSGGVVKSTEGIPLAHLNQSGATTGQVVKWNGTEWVADTDGGGDITGSGTTNYLPKWTGGTDLGDSRIFDNGTNVGIVTDSLSMYVLADTSRAFKISALGPSSVKWEGKISQETAQDETYTLTRAGNSTRMSFATSPGNEYGIGINGNSSLYFRGIVPATRMTFLGDGNISVNGFSSQTQFTIFQPSLDRAGGIRLNPTTSGNVADIFVNASNELVIHRTSEALRLANSGQLHLPEYTSSTSFPVTPVAAAVFGADGRIGTASYSPLSGTGTANRVAYWSGTDNITSSANFLFDGTKVSANTGTAITSYLSLNPNTNASSTALNGGLTLFDNGTNNLYGLDMGYGAAFGPRLFTAGDINFAKVISGSAPTAQSDFANMMTIKGATGNVGIGTTSPDQALHVSGNAHVTGAIYDSNNDPGTSAQILSSTVTGTDWVAASTLGDNWGSQTVTTTGSTLSGVGTVGSPLQVATGGIGATELASTAVTPATYINTTLTVDADGRITAASNGTAGGTNYQTFKDDGVSLPQRANADFISTATITTALVDNGSNATEVSFNVPTDGITATQIAANAVGASELSSLGTAGTYGSATQVPVFTTDADGRVSAVTNTAITGLLSGLTATRVPFASGAAALTDDANLTWNNTTKRLSVGNTAGSPAASVHIAEGSVASWEPLRAAGTVSGNMITSILNANNVGGASNNIVDLSVGGASAGDPMYRWLVNGANTFSAGIDNSDVDKWKLKPQTTPSTGSNVGLIMTADATPLVGINNDAPLHPLHVIGRATATVLQGISGTPTHTFGGGAGTSPTLGSITGCTNAIKVQFTTGTTPQVGQNIISVTYPTAFSNVSVPVFVGTDDQTSLDISLGKFTISVSSATALTIKHNALTPALSASTTYSLNIVTFGR